MKGSMIIIFLYVLLSCTSKKKTDKTPTSEEVKVEIIEKPLNYSELRNRLSLAYLKERYNIIQSTPVIRPLMIVLHYTDGGTASNIYNYFNSDTIEAAREFNRNESLLNVSSHYVVDRDGTIYHLIADTLFARHIIGLNYCSIGIENIGSKKEPLTHQQVMTNARLVRYLCNKYEIKYLIGHSEYSVFRNSILWKESDPDYYTEKEDPGTDFLAKVRRLVSDMNLKSKPE